MPIGRDRQLALAALGEAPVARQHLPDQPADQRQQVAALLGREVAPALGETRDQRIRAPHGLAEPGEVIPHGEVVDEMVGGVGDALELKPERNDSAAVDAGRKLFAACFDCFGVGRGARLLDRMLGKTVPGGRPAVRVAQREHAGVLA